MLYVGSISPLLMLKQLSNDNDSDNNISILFGIFGNSFVHNCCKRGKCIDCFHFLANYKKIN